MPQLFMALYDPAPQRGRTRGCIVDVHHDTVGRQILEQMRGALEEQRQEKLDAGRCNAGADIAVDCLFGKIPRKTQSIAAPELAHRVRIQGRLARWQQMNAVQLVERTLCVRIEAPDAVDVSIQQVDAVGHIRAHGKDIDERAADRELAMRHDLSDGGITGHDELCAQRLKVERFVEVYLERVGFDVTARCQALQQRVDGNQPHTVPRAR